MLPHLVRITELAKLFGAQPRTVTGWARALGLPIARCPVRGNLGRTPAGTLRDNHPLYLSTESAGKVLEAMLPGLANVAQRRAAHARLGRAARRQALGSAGVTNEVVWEGTGVPVGERLP